MKRKANGSAGSKKPIKKRTKNSNFAFPRHSTQHNTDPQ